MTAITPEFNGAAPAALDEMAEIAAATERALADHVENLQALLAREVGGRETLELAVAASHEREKRIRKALAALEGPKPAPEPEPPRRGRPPKSEGIGRGRDNNTWSVSQEKVDQVLAAMRAHPDASHRPRMIADELGLSMTTIRKALDTLRDRELVRIKEVHPRWGKMYALMPEARGDAS